MKKTLTKSDLVLVLILLAIGSVAFVLLRGRSSGDQALIYVDNELIASFPLSEDAVYVAAGDLGTNTVVIENGQAYVTDADCPDRICEQMGRISKPGETIVCLPHKLVVEISNAH